jgi:uncharacterized membrane protein
LGFFDQIIWKVSRGDILAYSSLAKEYLLTDHFQPILYPVAFLYKFFPDVRLLLLIQVAVMVFAALPLYLLAKLISGSIFFSFSVIFSYLFFIGTQWSILNEFHQATFSPLFIIFIYYGLERKITIYYLIGIIGLFFTKEELFFLNASIGIIIFLYYKFKKTGLFLFLFSVFSFFLLTSYFMPGISANGIYRHSHLSTDAKSPTEFLIKITTDPTFAIISLISPTEKLKTLFFSLFSYAFLPLFAPMKIMIPLMEQFVSRFLYTGPQYTMWLNVNHHAAPSAMLLAVACIYTYQRIKSIKKFKIVFSSKYLGILLILFTVLQDIYFKAPIHSIFKKQFYLTPSWVKDSREIVKKMNEISPNGVISVQNSLYPHLSQREKIYLLPEIYDSEYIVVDFHDGPNKYAPYSQEKTNRYIEYLVSTNQFEKYYQKGQAIILKRKLL